ncbi:MAG TPA: sensor domain-containing diguanylate cyclase [Kofleriaceae bacterium]|nr:sensor domain-containing diguanylate cyclase [Kofleriaceae bacterium]
MVDVSTIPAPRLIAIIAMQTAIARSASGLDNVMNVVVERAAALTGATGAVVEIVDDDMMAYRAACGSAARFVGFRLRRVGSLSGLCIAEGAALHARDTSVDPRVDRVACEKIGVASMVCVPLLHAGHAVGVLKVLSDRPHAFDPATTATLALLADVIAAAMFHAKEYDDAVNMSLHDGLTGLLNRRAFDLQLGHEMARSARHGCPLSVAMFDLDGLKSANDTLGHAAGDAILRDAATLLRSSLRTSDHCFRLGGDEFAAILPETGEEAARHAVARFVTNLLEARLGSGAVGVSAGVAELRGGEAGSVFVARADAALYDHKRFNHATRAGLASATARMLRR